MFALLLLPFVFYWSNAKSTRDHNAVDRAVVFVSAPIQWLVVASLDGISNVWHRYIATVHAQAENDVLRADNARLAAALVKREEQRLENERLRLLIGVKERAPEVKTLLGHVIATAPTPLFRSLRIDRGKQDGVVLGAPVINQEGLIGRVAALSDGYAEVMPLVDANSSTDVLVQRTRARGRVRGTGSDAHLGLQVEYLSRIADVEPGDVIITSGVGAMFPKGLLVGTIMGVERGAFGLYQKAVVEAAVDFGRIEEVLVILGGASASTTYSQEQAVAPVVAPYLNASPLVMPRNVALAPPPPAVVPRAAVDTDVPPPTAADDLPPPLEAGDAPKTSSPTPEGGTAP